MVELSEVDVMHPGDAPDWTVRVSEHGGFPRWDGPTDRAFEAASWAYDGPLAEAMAALGI